MRSLQERSSTWQTILAMVITILLSLIFHAAPTRVANMIDVLPLLPLVTLFIWSVRHPSYVPPWLIFFVGLTQDLLNGGIMGLWALSYLVAFAVARIRDEDAQGEDLPKLWLRFLILTAVALLVALIAGSAAFGFRQLVGFQELLLQGAVTVVTFPIFALLFARRKERSTFS